MPKVEKRVKMHVERVAPYREMFAPLDHPNAAPSSSASTAMAEQFGVDTSAAASVVASADEKMGEAFDPSVDPRPRHFKEAEELNAEIARLKEAREKFKKNAEGKVQRKLISEKIAEMERSFKERTKREADEWASQLRSPETGMNPLEEQHNQRMRFKKFYRSSQHKHTMGNKR